MNIPHFRLQLYPNRPLSLPALMLIAGVGLAAGIGLCRAFVPPDFKFVSTDFCVAPAYASLLAVTMIPVAVTICLLAFSLTTLCYPFVFLYCACRGFAGMFFSAAFGYGAWLLRFLLCFSSSAVAVIVWWLLLRSLQKGKHLQKDAYYALGITVAITVIDFRIIVPFLSNLRF